MGVKLWFSRSPFHQHMRVCNPRHPASVASLEQSDRSISSHRVVFLEHSYRNYHWAHSIFTLSQWIHLFQNAVNILLHLPINKMYGACCLRSSFEVESLGKLVIKIFKYWQIEPQMEHFRSFERSACSHGRGKFGNEPSGSGLDNSQKLWKMHL